MEINKSKIIRLPEVMEMVGLKRSSIYSYMNDGQFPKSIPLGGRSVGWLESEIEQWLHSKIQARSESSRGGNHADS